MSITNNKIVELENPPSQVFSQNSCLRKLKILTEDTRFAIVVILMNGSRHVKDLNAVLGLEQSLLSHHLKVLRKEGIVEATRDGKAVLYRLSSEFEATPFSKTINFGCCSLPLDC